MQNKNKVQLLALFATSIFGLGVLSSLQLLEIEKITPLITVFCGIGLLVWKIHQLVKPKVQKPKIEPKAIENKESEIIIFLIIK